MARVIEVPKKEIARGRPPHAIPGVATVPGEQLSPKECVRLVLRESFRAIHNLNQANSQVLLKIGALSSSLGLDRLEAGEALAVLSEAYSRVSEG
jgi:hypothetical protein